MMALHTMMGKQQFCEEPTARNSNRLPQKGNGAVRLRSSTLAFQLQPNGSVQIEPPAKHSARSMLESALDSGYQL